MDENYPTQRTQFCNFYSTTLQQDPLFYRKIIWTDEFNFSNCRISNRNIHCHCNQKCPRFVVNNNFECRFSCMFGMDSWYVWYEFIDLTPFWFWGQLKVYLAGPQKVNNLRILNN